MAMDTYQPYADKKILWEHAPTPRRVGLVLSGGAIRGVAHVGVLEVLEEHNIPIHRIVGVSAGAIVGGLYAAGVTPAQMRNTVGDMSWSTVTSIERPTLHWPGRRISPIDPPKGVFRMDKLIEFIHTITDGPVDFSQLKIPFAAVASDVSRDELIVLNDGDIAEAIRISSSVPGIFSPEYRDGRLLVDGGAVNNMPTQIARQMGADYIIAVDLLPPEGTDFTEPQNMMDLMLTSLYSLVRGNQGGNSANVMIRPEIAHISMADFSRRDELLEAGRTAAETAIPEILADLRMDAGPEQPSPKG
ncbi:MAG: patatin-like phospholipase family protein [Caldilineaceae bacterium]|nr:patatin-like phospholipase family protein [Caldilineaceae bacterium]